MSETTSKMFADISKEISVNDDTLSTLSQLAGEQKVHEDLIIDLEKQLKDEKAKLQKLKTETIPDFMDEVGISDFTTASGVRVVVEPFYQASIPKDRKDSAFRWLSEHGYEDLIKCNVTVSFGKSEYEDAVELCKKLEELGFPTAPVLSVHPMTLKGWVRMMAEENNEFPLDLFGAFIGRTTKLK